MSNREYEGSQCPFCRSENIVGMPFDVDVMWAWRNVECEDCGKIWVEDYKLIGYEEKIK